MVQKLLLLTMITQSCYVNGYFQNHCKGDDISKLQIIATHVKIFKQQQWYRNFCYSQ